MGATNGGHPAATAKAPALDLRAFLLHVAWLSILLGLTMEVILLVLAAAFGEGTTARSFAVKLVQQIAWSFFVCTGLAVGLAVAKTGIPAGKFTGFFIAPAAFAVARTLHKSVAQALAIASAVPATPSPFLLAAVKGIEYGILGLAIARIQKWEHGRISHYVATGFLVGLVFGGFVLVLILQTAEGMSAIDLFTRGVNELVFPVGCSVVVYAAEALGRRAAR
ncbi:hypothetical protein NET02_06425 [Thermomicrobiaceae bacterium CFH 74404]|uniref:Uncharacterized protein n=1 Tax=Thermalbibacter longus TaxID=2951981 RepID=A0AA41WG36_9BACT|nr:hypothetical protein [Thermalbibacter longus]MCM8748776.1 hypothetical protein [Thermalbibacter longus]